MTEKRLIAMGFYSAGNLRFCHSFDNELEFRLALPLKKTTEEEFIIEFAQAVLMAGKKWGENTKAEEIKRVLNIPSNQ